jgi:predicted metal-dependent phosphoesterase TrpH
MGFADLHIHSVYSWDGTSTISAILKYASDFTYLDVIAITDHDCLEGALEAVHSAPRYGIEVIPGCEISTAEGHLLALFIERSIPPGLSLVETVRRVGGQGGLCIAAHPGVPTKNSLSLAAIHGALQDPQIAQILVGIECYNGGLLFNGVNHEALQMAKACRRAATASSDSHVLKTIGRGATEFPGFFAKDLQRALTCGATHIWRGRVTSGLEKVYHWLPAYLLRRLGWVVDCPTPYSSLQLKRWTQPQPALPEQAHAW